MQHPIYLLRRIIGGRKRAPRELEERARLKNKDFSLFSSSCLGGVVCSDLGVRFNSPTVNVFIRFDHFLKMMENLPYYMSLTPVKTNREGHIYPVLLLDDVKIYCVHYHSTKRAIEKWVTRAKRVNYSDIRILLAGFPWAYPEMVERFEKLPYKKLIITDYEEAPDKPYVKKISCKRGKTATIFNFKNFRGERYYDGKVDFVEFFNN